jgi:hypothetical protein
LAAALDSVIPREVPARMVIWPRSTVAGRVFERLNLSDKGEVQMNVALTYQSGQQYSEYLYNFDVKVKRGTNGEKRVRISFAEKESGPGRHGHASFSLPRNKAKQLAHAVLTACAGDMKPIEFDVEEAPTKKVVAA